LFNHMKKFCIYYLILSFTCVSVASAQTPVDPKDLKKNSQVPLLQRDQSAQQLYLRIVQLEDERSSTVELISFIDNSHAGVRRRAILALGRIGDQSATGKLGETLIDDPNPKVREYAAFALGEIEDPRGTRALFSALLNKGETIEVRARATEALGKIAGLSANEKLLGVEVLERITSVLIGALPKSPAELKTGDELLIISTLTALLRIHPASAIDPVASQLTLPNPQIRFNAANSLFRILVANPGKASKEAISAAIAALKDKEPLVRAAAARALGSSKNPDAVEPLIALLNDSDEQVVTNTIRALGALEDRRATAPLVALGQQLLARYRASKQSLSPELNHLLLISTALGQIKDSDSIAFLKQLRLLPGGTIGSNLETETAIARLGAEAFFDYSQASELKPGDWQAASNFATGLGVIGGERTIKMLDELLAGKRAGTLDARAIPEILRAMEKVKHPNINAILRDYLANSEDVIVRATAAELLGESKNEEDLNALSNAYARTSKDAMNDAKLAILAAIAKSQKPQAVTMLTMALKDPDYVARQQAADLLRVLGKSGIDLKVGTVKTNRERSFYKDVLSLANNPKKLVAQLITSKGVIGIELFPEDAPLTVQNFLSLARKGYYNNTSFHRVVPNFVIQGGDPRADGNGGPGYQIRCEINMKPYVRGSVGMALSGKDTGGSQFFICHSPQPHLDGGYTVFGQVIEGLDVVDKITRGDVIEKVIIEE
jgi:cyclophilin family peptidyl-prolyl cis-trans isomerase/HEAT repeat protein